LKKRPSILLIIIATSLGLHLLLLYGLIQSHSFKAAKEDKFQPDRPLPIQARLVFSPINSPNESIKEVEPLRDIVKNKMLVPELATLEEQVVNTQIPTLAVKDEAESTSPVNDLPTPELETPAANIYGNVPDLARQQLSGLNQTKLQELALQAASDYQKQKNAPKLDLKRVNPFVTEEQKLRDSVQVKVNCDGNTNKVAAVISGLFGGTLKCSKPPGIKSFIKNRLNKAYLLPDTKNP
jgi:hypothetical protein